ncbi:MAG TPA: hypothetical protein V6D28_22170 [Leptolyngbyaceae cyanobacterium]
MQNTTKTNITKKPYVKPEVTVHGAVEDVTQMPMQIAASQMPR